MVLEKLSPGGYIIADNTLWDGHVLEEPHHTDLQTIGIKKFNDLVAADKRVEKGDSSLARRADNHKKMLNNVLIACAMNRMAY